MDIDARKCIEFYHKAFSEQALKEPDYYYDWIIELLNPNKGKKLLDVACGGGFLLNAAKEGGLMVIGVDISNKALNLAKSLISGIEVVSGDGTMLPLRSQTFDYVTCLGSLEHFQHPDRGVRELVRVLKKDGCAIITVPNAYFIKDIYMVWRKGGVRRYGQIIDRYGTKMEWEAFLENNGLRILETLKYNPKWKIRSFGHLIYRICRPLISLNLCYHFVFICSPR